MPTTSTFLGVEGGCEHVARVLLLPGLSRFPQSIEHSYELYFAVGEPSMGSEGGWDVPQSSTTTVGITWQRR